jgi:rhodanese-related sulfurtransferase
MRKLAFTALAAALMLALAAPAWALFGSKFEDELEKEKGCVKLAREAARGGYGLVTAAELKAWQEEGKDMVIVDTMPYEASYQKAHVPQAVQFLFPIPEMDEWDPAETGGKSKADFARLLGPDQDRTIVVYCGFVKCTRSHNGAMWAKRLGYTDVYRFPGGIYAWKGADYPAEGSD